MEQEKTYRFTYRHRLLPLLSGLIFAIVITAGLAWLAYEMPDYRRIRVWSALLSEDVVRLVFGGLALVCAGGGLYLAAFVFRSAGAPTYIELGANDILVPEASLSMQAIRIPYSAITSTSVVEVAKGKFMLVIASKVGDSRLLSSAFASVNECAAFIEILRSRLGAG